MKTLKILFFFKILASGQAPRHVVPNPGLAEVAKRLQFCKRNRRLPMANGHARGAARAVLEARRPDPASPR